MEKDTQILLLESEIQELRAENKGLRALTESLEGQLKRKHRKATELPFGSSTPSSKIPLKANSLEENQKKQGGAVPGHRGSGRTPPPVEQISRWAETGKLGECPCCKGKLTYKGSRHRVVQKLIPARVENVDYTVNEYYSVPIARKPIAHKCLECSPTVLSAIVFWRR